MAKVKGTQTQAREMRPALTPEARENQLVSRAYDLVEQRLMDGSATSQEVTHFLKLGSRKEILEREKLESENLLLKAKADNLQSQKNTEALYIDAIAAMQNYTGNGDPDDY